MLNFSLPPSLMPITFPEALFLLPDSPLAEPMPWVPQRKEEQIRGQVSELQLGPVRPYSKGGHLPPATGLTGLPL